MQIVIYTFEFRKMNETNRKRERGILFSMDVALLLKAIESLTDYLLNVFPGTYYHGPNSDVAVAILSLFLSIACSSVRHMYSKWAWSLSLYVCMTKSETLGFPFSLVCFRIHCSSSLKVVLIN